MLGLVDYGKEFGFHSKHDGKTLKKPKEYIMLCGIGVIVAQRKKQTDCLSG